MTIVQKLPRSFAEALQMARATLKSNSQLVSQNRIDSEAEQLVVAAYRASTGSQLSRFDFLLKANESFPAHAAEKLILFSDARASGRPLQYVIGYQVFLDHEYQVGPEVLIPRPETEVLLMSAVAELASSQTVPLLGLEIGLGSGILSIELLKRYPSLNMFASEFSRDARSRALENAQRILGQGPLGIGRLTTLIVDQSSDVLEPFQNCLAAHGLADFVITNPPYLTTADGMDEDVLKFEPHSALFAPNDDPLHFYRKIAQHARAFIRERGYVFAEMPHERSQDILSLFSDLQWEAKVLPDLNERDRILIARLKGTHG